MEGSRVRAYIREHPEVQEGWEELFRPIPEIEVALTCLRALKGGGERLAWDAFERCTGVRPDPLAVQSLRQWLPERAEDLIVTYLAHELRERRRRLEARAAAVRRAEAQEVLDGWYKFGELKRVLEQYPGEDKTTGSCARCSTRNGD